MFKITIPGHPVPKERPRLGRRGRVFTPQKTQDAEAVIVMLVRAALQGEPPLEGRLFIKFTFYCKHFRGDWDNISKLPQDALEKAELFSNDNKIDEAYVKRYIDKENPRTEITVGKLTELEKTDILKI